MPTFSPHHRWIVAAFGAIWFFAQESEAQTLPRFTDVTEEVGISYNQGGELIFRANEGSSGGAAAGDYDRDGWVDLFVTRIDNPPILYRNEEGTGFTDVTEAAGLSEAQPTGSNGAGWGDVDNDGDLDLYVTAFRTSSEVLAFRYFLYINNGDGTFTEEGNERGASLESENPHYGQSVSFGDYDRDGFLDIYVTEWASPIQNPDNLPSHNRLLRNLGIANPGYFVDVTEEAGVSVDEVVGDFTVREGDFAFTPRFSDLDGDGWLDLAIAADFEESVLFWNNGDGTFTNGTEAAGVGLDQNGMGATTADFNGDGLLDWFVTAIWEEGEPEHSGNFLYINNGDRTFEDRTDFAAVRNGFWGWGTTALDFDNDGDQDIVETNGYYTEEDAFFRHFARTPLRLWRNAGFASFLELSLSVGMDDDHSGRGILTFDYDRDGDLDVFVSLHAEKPILYRNDGGNARAWLRIRTVGTLSNRDGVGAFIKVVPDASAPGSFQVHEVSGSSNYLSQNEMTVHVGLGDHEGAVDLIEIRWPSGVVQEIEGAPANTVMEVVEPAGSSLLISGSAKLVNDGTLFQGNTYNGFELTGADATLSSLANEITRVSFLDPDGDLCFAEFGSSDPETLLTIGLSGFRAQVPSPYNQPGTTYVQGLASITIENANEATYFSIFSLGNDLNRVDGSLIRSTTFSGTVDGVADVRLITVVDSGSGTTRMGGINAANANFIGTSGVIGIAAEGVRFSAWLYLCNIIPSGTAQPWLRISPASSIGEILITGGDLAAAIGDHRIDTNGETYPFPIRATDGQRSISNSPLRADLGDGVLPPVRDTFVADVNAYFLSSQQVQ